MQSNSLEFDTHTGKTKVYGESCAADFMLITEWDMIEKLHNMYFVLMIQLWGVFVWQNIHVVFP